jgi:hypothetical protein
VNDDTDPLDRPATPWEMRQISATFDEYVEVLRRQRRQEQAAAEATPASTEENR